jgi:uncharacterized protein involved in type VI secretion and phage assembly
MKPPLYDLASAFAQQIHTAEAEASRVYEPVIGLVTDNKDPSKLGRIKVKYPVLSQDDTSWWAPIIMLGAGKNRGWFFIPEADDEVLVLFEHGDLDRPLVLGALWNGKDKAPDDNSNGKNNHRVIKSRAGSRVLFDDSQDTPQIVIEDGTGNARITIDAKNNKIKIEALKGDVCFQAPQGDLKIVAKTAELKAGQNVEVHAGSTMAWGTDAAAKINGGSSVMISGAKGNVNCGNASAPSAPSADPKDVPDPYGS